MLSTIFSVILTPEYLLKFSYNTFDNKTDLKRITPR